MILLGDAPTCNICGEIVLHRLFSGHLLNFDLDLYGRAMRRVADQRGMKARLVKALFRKLTSEVRIVHSWNHLERRLDIVLGIPAYDRLNIAFVPGANANDTTEGRQARLQRNG